MTAFVYILVHKDKPRFKIGKATDIPARLAQLTFDELDLTKSYALQVEDDASALNLERALHRCFSKWRLSPEEVVAQEGARFTGYTEWFRKDCFELLMNFVSQNGELFDYKTLEPTQLLALVQKPARPVRLVKSMPERRRTKRVVTAEDILGAKEKVQSLYPLLLNLVEHCEEAASAELGPGRRQLAGTCTAANVPVVKDLLEELFDQGQYQYSLCGFGIFNGIVTQGDDAGGLQFSVSHIWPSESDREQAPFAIAGMTLAELSVPVAGWHI